MLNKLTKQIAMVLHMTCLTEKNPNSLQRETYIIKNVIS